MQLKGTKKIIHREYRNHYVTDEGMYVLITMAYDDDNDNDCYVGDDDYGDVVKCKVVSDGDGDGDQFVYCMLYL